jgi:hypothetical protein
MSNTVVFEWEMSVFGRFLSLSLHIDPYIVGDMPGRTERVTNPEWGLGKSSKKKFYCAT